jgi:hypothetical protein
MKTILAITAVLVSVCSPAAAQSPQTLADVAKAEEARRNGVKKPSKVYTNTSLTPDITAPPPPSVPAGGSTPGNASSNATSSNATPGTIAGGTAAPVDKAAMKDQAYWQDRMSAARTEMGRTQMFADSLQTKIYSLRTDFVNRDNRVEREKIEQELNTALAELERLKKDIEKQQKGIAAIEDEARKAGVPSGWLRPQN